MKGITNELNNVLNNKYGFNENTKLKLLEVLFLANELLEKYKIKETEIAFRNHNHALGTCSCNGAKITLQLDHAIKNDFSEIKNTILHEIAHALVGNENGHNEIWQKQAIKMGVIFNIKYRK